MRTSFTLLVIACVMYVVHFFVPQPNGLGDLAAVVAGASLLFWAIKGLNGEL